MRKEYFKGYDFTDFWDDCDYAVENYIEKPVTDEMIAEIEEELGYKLPESYIYLMRRHNGGLPNKTCFPTDEENRWAEDHVAITGIYGIGRNKSWSLCGEFGSQFMIEEWGYPDIGVTICDTPTAGHSMFMLDYRKCGKTGEPEVIYIDQEDDYSEIFLAKNFEEFLCELVREDVYDKSEEYKQEDLETVKNGEFSTVLKRLCKKVIGVENIEGKIRKLCEMIVWVNNRFVFLDDERSMLMYDIQFWIYSKSYPNITSDEYLKEYRSIIAFGDRPFRMGGYAPDFVKDWLTERINSGTIIETEGFISFSEEAEAELVLTLNRDF